MGCQILDTSDTGARLMPVDIVGCPREFLLKLHDAEARPCEVVWRKGTQIGVRYPGDRASAGPAGATQTASSPNASEGRHRLQQQPFQHGLPNPRHLRQGRQVDTGGHLPVPKKFCAEAAKWRAPPL